LESDRSHSNPQEAGFVVLLDVANHFSGQVGGGGEDSPGNDIALDFGKPDFNLIKPARIGWSVTDPDGWIGIEELENTLGFMCAQVIGHDVNFSALRQAGHGLAQEVDKSALVKEWVDKMQAFWT
jgi:hypothetical protein